MAARFTLPDKIEYPKRELSYDEWMDFNMRQVCKEGTGRIGYVNRSGRIPNKNDRDKIIKELMVLDLADANATKATLTQHGEEVCAAGGWIEYLKKQENQSSLVNREIINEINNPQNTPARKMTRGESLGIILMILTIIAMFIIAYFEGVFNQKL